VSIEAGSLAGIKVLVLFANEQGKSTRPDRHIKALSEAGARVTLLGAYPEWLQMRLSKYEGVTFLPLEKNEARLYSENKIWLVRVGLNLTWYKFVQFFHRDKIIYEKMIKPGVNSRPQVVLCFNPPCFRVAKTIAHKVGAKLVYDSGEYWPEYAKNPYWNEHADLIQSHLDSEKECIDAAALVVTTSSEMSERLKEYYGIGNTVEFFNSQEDPVDFVDKPVCSPVRLVFHGMLGADRNLQELIRALEGLTDFTLDIYGDFYSESDRYDLESLIGDELGKRVTFHGPYNKADVRTFLPKYDMGIYPAKAVDDNFNVTLPNKLFDCIVHGLALAVPPFDAIESIVNKEQNGVIIDTSSSLSIQRDLKDILENPNKVFEMKAASRAVSQKYSRRAQSQALIAAYKGILFR